MKQKIQKILVTGAAGYLGTVLVKTLHDMGYVVSSLVLPGENVEYILPYSDIRYADICDLDALEREMPGFDVVIHLAGIIDISIRNRELMRRVNIGGTKNVAELCRKHGIKMIYCSSVHAIPCLPNNEIMTEIADFDPDKVKGLYSKTKAEATGAVLEMTQQGLDAMIAFPSGIIGPNERKLSNIGQLISDFLCGSLTAYVDGGYNFVDVRDVADGICGMLEHWQSGECYILSGHEISVGKMISEIANASGRKMLRTKLPYWFALGTSYFAEFYYFLLRKKPLYTHYSMQTIHSNCHFSNQKARDKIGFSPRPLQESMSDMTKWIIAHFTVKVGKKYKPCLYME
jgi:dihydroflavonol-4-reductase